MIILRDLELDELEKYKYWKLPHHKYHLFNGPYFKKDSIHDVEKHIKTLKNKLIKGKCALENKKIITNEHHEIIGEVSWNWKSKETYWMEIGIVIFNDEFWNKGIGYIALNLWVSFIFNTTSDINRLGISTWSGNKGMINLAIKLGMKKEAEYKNARIINGKYFDSVSYGILREEWNVQNNMDLNK